MITSNRKLQAEIDKVLKKVEEGTEEFDDTLNKVHEASNPSQKEKHENELKREIKKLQRFREQIKIWQTSSEIKNKTALAAPREQIENRMKLFKDLEKEAKTKPYSKEGLSRSTKTLSQNASTNAAASSATAATSGTKSISKSTSALPTRKSAGTSAPAGSAKKRGRKSRAAAAAAATKGEEGEESVKRPTKGMQVCRWLDACVDAIDAEIAVLEQQAAAAAETTTTTAQKKRKGAQKARDSTKVIEALRTKHRDNIVKVRALVAEHHIKPSLVEVYLKEDLDALLGSFASRGGPGVTLNDEDGEAEIEYPFLISSASDSFVEDEELEEDEIENVEEDDDEYDDDDEEEEEEEEDGYDDENDEYDDVDDVDDEREEGEEEVDDGNSDNNNNDDDDDDEVVTSNSDESVGVSRSGSATNESDEANTNDNSEKAKANTEDPAAAPETASTNGKPKTTKQEEKKASSDEDDIQIITTLNPQQQQQQQQQQQRIILNQSPTKPQQQRYTRSTQYHSRPQPQTTNPTPIGIMQQQQQQQQPRTRLFTTDEHIPSNSIQISTSPQAGDAAPRNTPPQLLRQSAGTQFAQFNALSRRILRAKERYVPQPYTPAEPVTEKDGPVPAWFPRKPLSVLSSQGVVSRMSEETLQFAFYLSQNPYQQVLAAKALAKLGWRFHTGKRLWMLSKGELVVEKGGECEVGDYYYYDWEDSLEKKVMPGFKFEYKFFDK